MEKFLFVYFRLLPLAKPISLFGIAHGEVASWFVVVVLVALLGTTTIDFFSVDCPIIYKVDLIWEGAWSFIKQ